MTSASNADQKRFEIIVCENGPSVDQTTAEIIADALEAKPNIVLGLATGSTPIGLYRELIQLHQEQDLDFSAVTSFNLDEYVGLAPDHPQSFRCFMQRHLFDSINIDPAKTHVPDGVAKNVEEHVKQYELQIARAGGIDLQLLGLGSNGHIAFNEPGSTADSRTREVKLTESTIEANARFFDSMDDVPRTAITMGIGTILQSRRIILMATGDRKSRAVAEAIEGEIGPQCPASLLRNHQDVTFILDPGAASLLRSQ